MKLDSCFVSINIPYRLDQLFISGEDEYMSMT